MEGRRAQELKEIWEFVVNKVEVGKGDSMLVWGFELFNKSLFVGTERS